MKTKILVTFLVVMVLAACNKDKYQTRPQLTYKKVNTKVLSRNQQIVFTIQVTDAEGDIQDTMWVQKVSKNCSASNFTAKYLMPQFAGTKNLNADIEVTYDYNLVGPKCNQRNDTAYFKFWIKDKAKNVSDTAQIEDVVILF